MKRIFVIILFQLLYFHAYSQQSSRGQLFNLDDNLALEGYDPLSYFTGKPLEGKEQHSYSYKGVTYHFVDAKNKETFAKTPEKYEPAYGGWCAYAMGESGEKVKVDPETFKVIEGRLYLFYNFWGNNTLKSWNKDEKILKTNADKNWTKIFH